MKVAVPLLLCFVLSACSESPRFQMIAANGVTAWRVDSANGQVWLCRLVKADAGTDTRPVCVEARESDNFGHEQEFSDLTKTN